MKKILLGTVLLLSVMSLVNALSNWSTAYSYELKSSDGWKRNTTVGEWMGNLKDSDKNKYDVYTVSKTMWSSPKFRVVNSDNAVISDVVTTASTGRYATGKENVGIKGYAYYGSVKPAWNQTGTDRIKLQFRVY